ncbi:hypothetical protein FQA39_LY06469 [Lamprigera yunnana]|nr:hypothetical protein FQA39_LY06469 [Lamprigera yunnana]
MSFNGFKNIIQKGDTVILYLTTNQMYRVKAEPKKLSKKGIVTKNIVQTPCGALKCASLIGKEYGTKIYLSKGCGYVLQPSPELWTLTLPHRTQIIYTPDISMIVLQLEIIPGSVVIESGTGSGSLSHAVIRAIKPHGHLYTFDFHQIRMQTAKSEFQDHGLSEWVTVIHKDVCGHGFGDDLENKADAVFLDLPLPWLAIPYAKKCIKSTGGRLGFQELQTMEIVRTKYSIQTQTMEVLDFDSLKTEKAEEVQEGTEEQVVNTVAFMPPNTQPGHSGYLTFATLPPSWATNFAFEKCSITDE